MDLWTPIPVASIVPFVLNMVLGLLLSILVAGYYRAYGRVLGDRHRLAVLMPLLTLTTGIVISVVKSSLALSLGLVGALSIVRFRTAVKEPEELLYLFISIAIGLGVGAEQRGIVIAGVALLLVFQALRNVLGPARQPHNLYLNIAVTEDEPSLLDKVGAILVESADVVDFRRLDSRDGTLHLTFLIVCDDPGAVNTMVDKLRATLPVTEISLLQQEQVLGG